MKMQMEDDEKVNRKQLKIVSYLFANRDIQMNADHYIGSIISDHKGNIQMKFAQWKVRSSDKLSLLRFICLSMSALDRFVSSSNRYEQDTYYRISATIDGEITKGCDDNIKLIMPSFENAAWNRLKDILKQLKKTADADKDGIGQKNYRDAVLQLIGLLNKLINETKSKLLIEINKDNNINEQKIFNLKEGLDKVKNLVEIVTEHLYVQNDDQKDDQSQKDRQKDKIENDAKALASLLSSRLKQLEDAAISSAKKSDFKQCEKRLDNIKKLTDCDTGFYINDITHDEEKSQKKTLRQQIDEQLDNVEKKVKKASKSLTDLTAFNPYQRLRLRSLHDQLSGSQDDKFRDTWDNIQEEIVTTIQNILTKIKERNNQIQTQSEYADSEFKTEHVISYSTQQSYFSKIEMSLSLFPKELKGIISTMLKVAKESARGNEVLIGEGFQQYLDQNSWSEAARNLKDFETHDRRFFNSSRQKVVEKITKVFTKFNGDMKTESGLMDIIESLSSYKEIGMYFTSIFNDNPPIKINHIQSTLNGMYKRIENQFIDTCRDIDSSLTGQKEYKYLENGFSKIIKLLQYKDKLPQNIAKQITEETNKLFVPIQKLINKLNADKNKGLDKDNHDIDKLINSLDVLKELNNAKFHSNIRMLIPLIDVDEKDDVEKLDKDIQNIKYDITVKQTKDMLTGFKKNISEDGLKREIIQQNQAKREEYLKNVSNKCKSLINCKSSNICKTHLEMKQEEFEKIYIKPCTKRMKEDIEKLQQETFQAFTRPRLHIAELQRANANMDAFYAMKNIFETEINDEKLCDDIKIADAIETCEDTVTQRIQHLTAEIQVKKKIKNDDMDEYMQQCAQNLMNLEYLNQHMNFKTSINTNSSMSITETPNELKKRAAEAINRSMRFLTTNKQTKRKINTLYNHLIDKDANYGIVFTQQHSAFAAAFAEMMNQRFRELPIDDIIINLKKTEEEFRKTKLMLNGMINIDYQGVKEKFEYIVQKYNELIQTNLRSTTSFENLKQDKIPRIASNARVIARHAVNEKNNLLQNFGNLAKSAFSWAFSTSNSKKNNPRDCCWTNEMRGAVPDLIAHILAVWTLSSSSCYYNIDGGTKSQKTLMKARNAQIIAICCVLSLDVQDVQQKKLINNLVEVGTGEGKSLIIAVTATVLALLDFDVYCACYSELLSSRDKSAFNDLFLQFNVAKNIEYHTFNKVLEKMINDGGDVRDMAKNIVLSKNIVHGGGDEKKNDEKAFNKRQKILFIDEVDKFFSTDFFGKQYTPVCVIPSKEMKDLIKFVWKKYVDNGSNGKAITEQNIRASNQYKALLAAFNHEWHVLLQESIKDIIDGIRTFKDDFYKIDKNGRDICYKFSDTYTSKVFYGYRTLFTYLYELHVTGNITNEKYVDKKLTWFLKCGSFSYSEIPNNFYAILGVTGTLKSLSKKEHDVIQNSYGIRKYIVMPSLFDKAGKLHYAINRDISIINPVKANFYNELHAIIKTYENNGQDDEKSEEIIFRPVIVFFKDECSLHDFYKIDVCKEWRMNDRIQLLTPDLTETEKKTGILNATKPNQITFATEEYGRGIDFKVFDRKLKTNGMHVELTYWPETLAEEIQIKGRTARQGQRGSFHIILNEPALIDQCSITTEDIEQHRNDGDLYAYLNQIRNKVFEKQYDEALSYVKQSRPIHRESEQLAISLRIKNIPAAKEQLLYFNKGANIQSAARLSIVIDATGSMTSCLTQCKTVIQKTIPELVQFLKNNNLDTDQFEIQVVAYRNYNADKSSILVPCEFSSDVSRLTTFIHSLNAYYGMGNEAVEVAFAHLNKQNKKPNVVVLMADAPANSKSEMMEKRQMIRGEKYWMKAGGIFRNKLDWNQELNKFMNENNDASVFCFYLRDKAKHNFNQIASIAGGISKSMHLNINNEVASIALLQSALSEAILLKMNNGNMSLVNKFREQNKNKNMPTFL